MSESCAERQWHHNRDPWTLRQLQFVLRGACADVALAAKVQLLGRTHAAPSPDVRPPARCVKVTFGE